MHYARRRSNPAITRTVWFYRIFIRKDGDAIERVDSAAICNAVRAIPPVSALMSTGDGNGVVLSVPNGLENCLEMLRVRFTDHPGTWENGTRGELALRDEQALTEPTFVRFFPGNIVAIDVNRSGPWPTALRDYLRDRLRHAYANFQMVQIADRTAMERLNQITSVKRLNVQIANATLARIPRGRLTYLDYLKDTASLGGEGAIEIIWKRLNVRDSMNAASLKALVQYFIEHQGDPDDKLKIELEGFNDNGNAQSFSLRRDFVHTKIDVNRTTSRRIDPTDAYEKLRIAHNGVVDRFPPQQFIL